MKRGSYFVLNVYLPVKLIKDFHSLCSLELNVFRGLLLSLGTADEKLGPVLSVLCFSTLTDSNRVSIHCWACRVFVISAYGPSALNVASDQGLQCFLTQFFIENRIKVTE